MFMSDGEICPQVKRLCQMAKYILKSNIYVRCLNISSNQMFMPDGEICPQVKCLCQMVKYVLKSNVYVRW